MVQFPEGVITSQFLAAQEFEARLGGLEDVPLALVFLQPLEQSPLKGLVVAYVEFVSIFSATPLAPLNSLISTRRELPTVSGATCS